MKEIGRKDENSPPHPANLLIFLSICIIWVRFIPFIWVLKLPSVGVLNNGLRPRSGYNKMFFWCCWNCNTAVIDAASNRNWGSISCNWPQFCATSTRIMTRPHLLPWLLFKILLSTLPAASLSLPSSCPHVYSISNLPLCLFLLL